MALISRVLSDRDRPGTTNYFSTEQVVALERLHPALPMRPRQVERIEFEYIRHGTQTLLANWHIALMSAD
jgi:hypothetical protein